MSQQLSFDLPSKPTLGRDDFVVAPSNAMAVAMVENTPQGPGGKLILSGPAGSGKTHLTHVWSTATGATVIPARDLPGADIPQLASGPVAIEDVPDIAGAATAQDALFHLHNLVLANGHRLLLTGRGTPRHWGLSLPDLQSRMEGTQAVALEPPDDALLSAVLTKLFADRQIAPKPDVIPYLLKRMERSFEAAQALVDQLDRAALDHQRSLTRRFVAECLGGADDTA